MKFKKIMAIILATAMLAGMSINSFAAEQNKRVLVDGIDITVNIEEEIRRAKNGITDLESPNVMTLSENDPEVDTYTTTRKIEALSLANVDSDIYATTSVAFLPLSSDKSDSNSIDDYYVTAYGTIYWRDNAGSSNEFLGANGGWDTYEDPNTGEYPFLSNAKVTISGNSSAGTYKSKSFTVGTSTFEFGSSDFTPVRLWYGLDSSIRVNSSDTLKLSVSTSMFS